jgi:hypothetical protein
MILLRASLKGAQRNFGTPSSGRKSSSFVMRYHAWLVETINSMESEEYRNEARLQSAAVHAKGIKTLSLGVKLH